MEGMPSEGAEKLPKPEITLRSVQQRGDSDYPQKNLTGKILTPKYGGRFILASPTKRSNQVNPRSLCSPCLISCV